MLRYRVVMGYPRARRLASIICVCTTVLACTRAKLVIAAPETSGVAAAPSAANVQQNRFYDSGKNKEDKGDLDGALADYNRAIEQNPKDGPAYVSRGIVRATKGDRKGAIADFNRAIQLNPNYAPAYYDRAIVEEEGDLDVALKDCNRAVELDPKDPDAYRVRGDIRAKNDDNDDAIADYDRAIALNHKDSDAFAGRGACKLRQKRVREAMADLDAAIELSAKDWRVFFLRGLGHSNLADELSSADAKRHSVEAAVEDYTRSIELSPRAPSFYFRSTEYERLKRYDEALKDAEEAVRLDPKDASYLAQRGWMYRRTHQESLAQNDFRRALELDPGNKDAAEAIQTSSNPAAQMRDDKTKALVIGAAILAGGVLLNQMLSHDDAAPREEELQKIIAASDGTKVRCPKCNGSGRIVRRVLEWVPRGYSWADPFPTDKTQEWRKHEEKCDRCDGKGWVDK